MAAVINIEDYRPEEHRPEDTGPVAVTFFAPAFTDEHKNRVALSFTLTIMNGDFDGTIAAFRENGGMYVPPEEGGDAWFLPWPPAAVRIRPLTEEEIAALQRPEQQAG